MFGPRFALAIAALLGLGTLPVSAHVTLEQKTAAPGPYKAVFGVPHGCSGSSTTTVRVTIPEGVIGVKPMPKPGWTLTTSKGAYARAYDFFHGVKLSEGVKEVVWSGGKLLDEHFDEFTINAFVSNAFSAGDGIAFSVTQDCETGSIAWTEITAPGGDPHALKTPAPVLRIVASQAAAAGPVVFKGGEIVIEAPWARATPGGATVGAGYLTISNSGAVADRLVAVSVPVAARSEIHEMSKVGDVMKMRKLADGIEIPAGGTVSLAPGGLHVMFLELSAPLKEGDVARGELTFEKAGKIAVEFKVMPVGAASSDAHSHH